MSFKLQTELVDADEDCFYSLSSGVPRVGPAGLPRYGRGHHSRAAAGRATAVKLQTNREFQCLDAATTFTIYGRVDDVKTSRFSSATNEPCLESHGCFSN
jgi:hypothetical protein